MIFIYLGCNKNLLCSKWVNAEWPSPSNMWSKSTSYFKWILGCESEDQDDTFFKEKTRGKKSHASVTSKWIELRSVQLHSVQ